MAARLSARLLAGFAVAALLLGSALAPAVVSFTVNTTNDAVADFTGDPGYTLCQTAPGNGFCSLRAAIMNANRRLGGATIHLPAGVYPLQVLPTGPDDDASGDLNISSTVTLLGAGAAGTIVDGGGTDDVFHVNLGAVLTMTGVTVRNGAAQIGLGGGIASFGRLILADSVITGNTAGSSPGAFGGGLFVNGTSTLTNVTIAGNSAAEGRGGGVFVDGTSALTDVTITGNVAGRGGGLGAYGATSLTEATIAGNLSSGDGGGLYAGGPLTLTDTTVDNNQAAGAGGGLYVDASLTAFNATISNNSAAFDGGALLNTGSVRFFQTTIAGNLADSAAHGGYTGGGLYNSLGRPLQLWNTLLADNYLSNTLNECGGDPLTLEDYNYFDTVAGCPISRTAGIIHDVIGGDPLLAELADNGGATQTRALLAGSPALDQIPPAQCRDAAGAAPVPDQRGVVRPINGLCDIGAYEGHLPGVDFRRNLVRNGAAEAAAGSPSGGFIGVPVWSSGGGQLLTVVPYNTPGGYPSVPTDTVPAIHGFNFFAGGVSAVAVGVQNIDVSPLAGPIDEGGVTYDFSADLGGFDIQTDRATVEADFLDASSDLLMQTILGPVTAADRGQHTGLLPRADSALVPIHTRTVELFVTLTRDNPDFNDGYADNISLLLLPRAVLFAPLLRR